MSSLLITASLGRLGVAGLVYLCIGGGIAMWLLRTRGSASRVDAGLSLVAWPVCLPQLLMNLPPAVESGAAATFLAALERARLTPLSGLLPGPEAASALAARLHDATARVAEIDGLLGDPAFSEAAALARRDELTKRGDERAALVAQSRADNIARLRSLRDHFASELAEVGEIIAQVRIQAEVLRIAGAVDGASHSLINGLVDRIEALDVVLADEHRAA